MKKGYKIDFVEIQQKTKKGQYIRIQGPKQKPKFYKYNPKNKIDYYIKYYEAVNKKKKPNDKRINMQTWLRAHELVEQGINKKIEYRTRAERYLKHIRNKYKKGINEQIKAGIATANIEDALTATNRLAYLATEELLQELVLDKDILHLISTEENIKKLKTRMEYRISIKDKEGETFAETNTFNKTPMETIQEIKNSIKKGETYNYKEGYKSELDKKLKNKGYNEINQTRTGKVNKVSIQIIFRKAN